MSEIVISLVSEQTIPNVLFIREMNLIPKEFEYIFISTKIMKERNIVDRIIKGARISETKCKTIIVDEYSLNYFKNQLNSFDFKKNDKFYVNLTGGTKMMAIGAYNFFSEKNSEIYYVQYNGNSYRKIYPEGRKKEKQLNYRIGLRDYLLSYGIKIKGKAEGLVFSEEVTKKVFLSMIKHKDINILGELRKYRKRDFIEIDKPIGLYIKSLGLPINGDYLGNRHIRYITGGWFEEFIFSIFKQALKLSDDEIMLSVDLDINNEIDVMFIKNNSIYLIECKTGFRDGKRNLFNDTLYKSNAIKRNFGLRVRQIICTIDPSIWNKHGQIKTTYQEKLELYETELFDQKDLLDKSSFRNRIKQIVS